MKSNIPGLPHGCVDYVLGQFYNDSTVCLPQYCGDIIASEEDAQRHAAELPCVYIWGETRLSPTKAAYTVSLNGPKLTAFLEQFVPANNPSFGLLRDAFMKALRVACPAAVTDACEQTSLPPSLLFARKRAAEFLETESSSDRFLVHDPGSEFL